MLSLNELKFVLESSGFGCGFLGLQLFKLHLLLIIKLDLTAFLGLFRRSLFLVFIFSH